MEKLIKTILFLCIASLSFSQEDGQRGSGSVKIKTENGVKSLEIVGIGGYNGESLQMMIL